MMYEMLLYWVKGLWAIPYVTDFILPFFIFFGSCMFVINIFRR